MCGSITVCDNITYTFRSVSFRSVFANQLDRFTLCTFPFRLFETEDKNVHKPISIGTVVNRSVSRGTKIFIGVLRTALHEFLVFA